MSGDLQTVIRYHEATKHHTHRYARGPGYLDWNTQPDPFRRHDGADLVPLEKAPVSEGPAYGDAFVPGSIAPAPVTLEAISRFFFDSLSISAWKSSGGATWALRVNPSSGNLHPTEGYLVCGPIEGLCERPVVCHYAPREHALEARAEFSTDLWNRLTRGLPDDCVLFGLTSIHWREAWKYGERAYRYCQHDVGHALGAARLAASGLGWQARVLDALSSDQLSALLGVSEPGDAEPETPDCVLAAGPGDLARLGGSLDPEAVAEFSSLGWQGRPNRLSSSQVPWDIIEEVFQVTRKPETAIEESLPTPPPCAVAPRRGCSPERAASLRQIVRQRRSAVAMDGRSEIGLEAFFTVLERTVPHLSPIPFDVLPWPPRVHLAVFVHRVKGLERGLYLLVRDPQRTELLRECLSSDFSWETPGVCPDGLGFFLLSSGDARSASRQISCNQEIASEGAFSLGMVAEFQAPLESVGPWLYPRLFWECGLIGQVLYLEAEAASLRGTGIGCFLDDAMHELLGLSGTHLQDLYHFTIGGPVEDSRVTDLPAYVDA